MGGMWDCSCQLLWNFWSEGDVADTEEAVEEVEAAAEEEVEMEAAEVEVEMAAAEAEAASAAAKKKEQASRWNTVSTKKLKELLR